MYLRGEYIIHLPVAGFSWSPFWLVVFSDARKPTVGIKGPGSHSWQLIRGSQKPTYPSKTSDFSCSSNTKSFLFGHNVGFITASDLNPSAHPGNVAADRAAFSVLTRSNWFWLTKKLLSFSWQHWWCHIHTHQCSQYTSKTRSIQNHFEKAHVYDIIWLMWLVI